METTATAEGMTWFRIRLIRIHRAPVRDPVAPVENFVLDVLRWVSVRGIREFRKYRSCDGIPLNELVEGRCHKSFRQEANRDCEATASWILLLPVP
jgi:hypothetical protein